MLGKCKQGYSSWLHEISFTASGRPKLLKDEIELAQLNGVNFYNGDIKVVEQQTAMLTSTRVLFYSSKEQIGVGLWLTSVNGISYITPYFRSPKFVFQLRHCGNDAEAAKDKNLDLDSYFTRLAPMNPPTISVSVDKKDAGFQAALKSAHLECVGWWKRTFKVTEPVVVTEDAAEPARVAFVGIGGVLERKRAAQTQIDATLQEAFTDLDSLMAQAQNVMTAANSLQARAQEQPEELDELLLAAGLANPVTRQTAGVKYFEELARQQADFLQEPLQVLNAQTLADAYCLYCKARGTALISPEDMAKACEQWAPLGLPLRLQTFASGAKVVQHASFDLELVLQTVVTAITQTSGLAALEIASRTRLNVTQLHDYLLELLQRNVLLEDITPHGVYYYINRFPSFQTKGLLD